MEIAGQWTVLQTDIQKQKKKKKMQASGSIFVWSNQHCVTTSCSET